MEKGKDRVAKVTTLSARASDWRSQPRNSASEAGEDRLRAGLANRDLESLQEFICLHGQEIYSFAYRFLGNREDARDAAQQTLLKALQHLDQFDPKKGRLRSWLLKIASNHCLNELRKRSRNLRRVSSLEDPGVADVGGVTRVSSPGENSLAVRQALGELEPDDRRLIIFSYYHGLTYQEMADLLEVPVGTVKSRLSRAVARLRKQFLVNT